MARHSDRGECDVHLIPSFMDRLKRGRMFLVVVGGSWNAGNNGNLACVPMCAGEASSFFLFSILIRLELDPHRDALSGVVGVFRGFNAD